MEVDAALRALLEAMPHPVKVLLTTRIAPRELLLLRPERQMNVPLDAGLPSPYAEAVLRAGDPLGVLGLRDALDQRLAPACEFTRGFPRALEALTAALNADRATTLDELLAGPPPANVVEALVGHAYSRLDSDRAESDAGAGRVWPSCPTRRRGLSAPAAPARPGQHPRA